MSGDAEAREKARSKRTALLVEEGNACLHKQEFNKAVDCFSKAIGLDKVEEEDGTDAKLYFFRAQSYMSLKKPKFAIRDLEQAVSITKDHIPSVNLLAQAYLDLGKTSKAITVYLNAGKANPDAKQVAKKLNKLVEFKDTDSMVKLLNDDKYAGFNAFLDLAAKYTIGQLEGDRKEGDSVEKDLRMQKFVDSGAAKQLGDKFSKTGDPVLRQKGKKFLEIWAEYDAVEIARRQKAKEDADKKRRAEELAEKKKIEDARKKKEEEEKKLMEEEKAAKAKDGPKYNTVIIGKGNFGANTSTWKRGQFSFSRTGINDPGYDEYILSVGKQPDELKTKDDINTSLTDILDFFNHDLQSFSGFVSTYLDKNIKKYDRPEKVEEQVEDKKEEPELKVQTLVVEREGKEEELENEDDLVKVQLQRRRESAAGLKEFLDSEDGRKMSNVEKNVSVVEAAIKLAYLEDEEDLAMFEGIAQMFQEDEEEEDDEDYSDMPALWEFLPYEPIPGDMIDEMVGEQVNTFEIDIRIRRTGKKLSKKQRRNVRLSKRVNYLIKDTIHKVRCIHGVLLVHHKETDHWTELTPFLKEVAGMGDKK